MNVVSPATEESEDEYFDPLGAVKTPPKPVFDLGSPVLFVEREPELYTWSIQINQFFPLNCESTPQLTVLRRRDSVLSSEHSILSPRLSLNKIQNIENSFKLLQLEYFPSIMDERVHKARLADLKKEVVKVYLRIDNLTANDVTMGDRDTYRTDQAETRKLFTVTREHLYDLIDELDDDDPTDQARTTVVKGIDKKLTDKFKENDEAVKERMVEHLRRAISAGIGSLH